MNYKKTYQPTKGYTKLCVKGECSLQELEFGIIELGGGESLLFETGETETAFVILSGKADFAMEKAEWKGVGQRRSVFEGKACTVYAPRRNQVKITGVFHVKIAVCQVQVETDTEPQLIQPEAVRVVTLGVKPWERETHFIIEEGCNARKLCIGEAFVTPGNWAGVPPHKHDVDNMPREGILEELYYFLFQPGQGFAIQKLYTKDGEIDVTYTVKQDELVEFPRGYHTTVGAPGYNTYFLWVMAGEHQGFYRSNDPDHDWVTAAENMVKKL